MDLATKVADGLYAWRELSDGGVRNLRDDLRMITREVEADLERRLYESFDCRDMERILGVTNDGLLATIHLSIEDEATGTYLYPNFHFYQLEKFDIVGEVKRVEELLEKKTVEEFTMDYGKYTSFKGAVQIEVERNQAETFLALGLERYDYESLDYILEFKERVPELVTRNKEISYTGTMGYVDDSDYLVTTVYEIIGDGDFSQIRKNLTSDDLLVLKELWEIPNYYQGFKKLVPLLIG